MFVASAVAGSDSVSNDATGTRQTRIISIIPRPSRIQTFPGQFEINDSTSILCDLSDNEMIRTAELLAGRLRTATGYKFPILGVKHRTRSNYLLLQQSTHKTLGNEGYEL